MNRFILLSFLVMGWAYYELSGGAGFVPETRPETRPAIAVAPAADPAQPPVADTAPDITPAATDPLRAADPLDGVTVVTRDDTDALDALPEADSIAPAAIAFEADSVADALAQALTDPVVNTGEPAALPEQTASARPAADAMTGAADLREVTGDSVNLREGPGTNFSVVDRLTRGTVISVLDTGPDGWVYVEINGRTGWMSSDFIGPAI